MKRFLFLAIICLLSIPAYGYEKNIICYAVRDGQELHFDHYRTSCEGLRPCVIFEFGGGFTSGKRNMQKYMRYFEMLVSHGYDVISIDYRLEFSRPGKTGFFSLIGRYRNAVRMAAEDLLDATAYILKHSEALKIDPHRIYATGSSAGAIGVLTAEHMICNHEGKATRLPEHFNYAGIVSFAGAVFSMTGTPSWDSQPCPILFFHGNADSNVPYDRASLFGIGMYGPKSLIPGITKAGGHYIFHSAVYRDHKMATEPMNTCSEEILEFLNDHSMRHTPYRITHTVMHPRFRECRTDFSLSDYLSHDYKEK